MTEEKLNISVIKQMLQIEIDDYYNTLNKKKNTELDIKSLEEIIKLLESENFIEMYNNYIIFDSLLPTYFKDNIETYNTLSSELYKSIYLCSNYMSNPDKYLEDDYNKAKNFIKKFKNKLLIILETYNALALSYQPIITTEQLIEYKRIKTNLKFGKKISSHQYEELLKLFERKGLTDKQKILLLEKLRNHNVRTHIEDERKLDYSKIYEITNIELLGFEEFENITWIEDERKKELDSLIQAVKNLGIDEDITIHMLPSYKGNFKFSQNYELSHIKYLYITLLKYYQDEILEAQQELNKLENYLDKEYRDYLVKLCKDNINNYLIIRKKYDDILSKYNSDFENLEEENDIYRFHYAAKESGITYFESDLKDMEKDTYKSIKELIIKFKKGLLNDMQTKQLNEAFPGNKEIKDDQIRIIYRHVKDNEYVIVGVFSKKDDNPIKEYKRICNRPVSKIINDTEIEDTILEQLDENSHLGGRRNTK